MHRRIVVRRALGSVVCAVALLFTSCAGIERLLGRGTVRPPDVTFIDAKLVQAPSQSELSAYYCPSLLREQAGLGFTADLVCGKLFGKAPDASRMEIGFDLRFQVANPNRIPLPLAEILTAVSVFPGTTKQNLGAICLKLCAPGDANCRGGADPRGCREAPGDIKSLEDFPRAVASMLIAQGLAAGDGRPVGFSAPQVNAGSSLEVVARLAIVPEALLPAMEELARQSIGELKAGKLISFQIPYQLEGTVFGDAGSLGRIAAGFGPVEGAWAVPAERLIP